MVSNLHAFGNLTELIQTHSNIFYSEMETGFFNVVPFKLENICDLIALISFGPTPAGNSSLHPSSTSILLIVQFVQQQIVT
jgi:hypothetical protein